MLRASCDRSRALGLAVAAAALLLAGAPRAQETPAVPAGSTAPGALSEEQRARLAELEGQIAELATRAQEWSARAAEYEEARASAPTRLVEIERDIAQLSARSPAPPPAGTSAAELQASLVSVEQDLSGARRESAELEAEEARRAERRKKVPELLAAAKERLRALAAEPAPPGLPAPLAEARQRHSAARRLALEREIEAYEKELASYEARGQLLVKRLDRATLRIAAQQARVEELRGGLSAAEQREGERATEHALAQLAETQYLPESVQGAVREIAEQNAQLAAQRTGEEGLVGKIDDVSRKLSRAESSVADVEADLARVRAKVEAAGLTESVGLLLRRQRSAAPDVGKYQRFVRMRQELISSVQLQQLELQEQRRALADLDGVVADSLRRLDGSLSDAERTKLEPLLRDLLETRRRYLDQLIDDYETYFQKLVDFDARQLELIDKTQQLLQFIDTRVLWMPSAAAVRPGLLQDAGEALGWLLTPRFWGQFWRALLDALLAAPLLNASFLLLFAGALLAAPRVRARLRALGEQVRAPASTRFLPTSEALLLSLLLAPWLPALVGWLGWRVGNSADATQFARCIAHGMVAAALFWASVEAPRQMLRAGGLAEAHFGWEPAAVASLRRWLDWLLAAGVPAVLVVYTLELRGEDAWRESIGRALFLVAMLGAAAFTHATLRPSGPLTRILRPGLAVRPWVWRLLHYLALGVPLFLAAAAARGFYWTALRLGARYHFTLVVLFGLVVAFALVMRWSQLARVRAGQRRALEREQARAETAAAPREAQAPSEPGLDLAAADQQTGRLLKSSALLALLGACWLIWADVLPAGGILREVELWDTTQTVTVEIGDAAGETRFTSEERIVPITLADLAQALLIALMTLVIARNLPGLVEIALPTSLGMGSGERYAFATIAQYGTTVIGAGLAFQVLGASWANIQWLVAAVGLGLGFGLQEIFANFVSGVIILFERPIRVGDTVTVGDVSGTVTKIRIRATWITGFDRKELVVPNKEFVTGRLVNWSLTDATLRVEIPVGIAYGSDTDKALEVLRQVARENRLILKEPEPQVLFLGFGDSSLNFELRVFSPDVAHLLRIRHELHMAIDKAFRAAGIEIAFPQRDLHLRSWPESALLPLAEREESR